MAFLFIESSSHENSSVLQNAANTLKVLLLLAGVFWTLAMVRGALLSFSCEIVSSSLVGFWSSIRCFLSSPLYICIIINSMVLLIAASSTFHRHENEQHHAPPPPDKCSTTTSTPYRSHDHDHDQDGHDHDYCSHSLHYSVPQDSIGKAGELSSLRASPEATNDQLDEREDGEDEGEGEDTMEATWKAITGAKTKELKKSETFNEESITSTSTWKDLRKSETFNESVSIRRVGGLMRDPSIGIDEFNQQVEAFIKKFNANMRLQRQESDQRFMDMVKRGL